MTSDKKSPLKDKPLRVPGQSVDEEITKIIDEEGLIYVLLIVFSIVLAAHEWYRWYFALPYSPKIYTAAALVLTALGTYKIIKIRKRIKHLKQGRDGEKAVGQHLELLREDGCKVFHDIVGNGFNVDHVVISTNGIFIVETKTYSKPSKGRPVIRQKGDELFIDGNVGNPHIVVQAKAEAHWLKSILRDISGRGYEVKPVVVFPGWFIEQDTKGSDVWVLNPKALRTYIKNSAACLTREEVQFLANGLSRHIRNTPD